MTTTLHGKIYFVMPIFFRKIVWVYIRIFNVRTQSFEKKIVLCVKKIKKCIVKSHYDANMIEIYRTYANLISTKKQKIIILCFI